MFTQERGEYLHDWTSVGLGVPADALEGVDAAQPDVELLVAWLTELVDGPCEALGDLTLSVEVQRPGSAEKQDSSADHLYQGGPKVVFRLEALCVV